MFRLNGIKSGPLWLASFIQHSTSKLHPYCTMSYIHVQHFIPFYWEIKFDHVGMLCIIYPFISRWTFGFFPFGAIMNKVAWTFVYKFLCRNMFSFLLDVVNSVSLFEELSLDCFPKWLHHFTFPPRVLQGPSVSPSSLELVICLFFFKLCLFDYSHLIVLWVFFCTFFMVLFEAQKSFNFGNLLPVQWLRLGAFTARA